MKVTPDMIDPPADGMSPMKPSVGDVHLGGHGEGGCGCPDKKKIRIRIGGCEKKHKGGFVGAGGFEPIQEKKKKKKGTIMKITKRQLIVLIHEELGKILKEGRGDGQVGQWPESEGVQVVDQGVPYGENGPGGEAYSPPGGDSVTNEDIVRSIYNHLLDSVEAGAEGWDRVAGQFMEIMQEHGVVTIEGANKIRGGHKIRDARSSGYLEDED